VFGLVITIPRKCEKTALDNILRIRARFRLDLPIEVWELGEEISLETRKRLHQLKGVIFKDVGDFTADVERWRGFQIKAFAARHTSFDEFLLAAPTFRFWQNPLKVLSDEGYKRTGTFFFRDLKRWRFHGSSDADKLRSIDFFNGRKTWLRSFAAHQAPVLSPRMGLHVHG
jgi:hypothetical protein